MGWKNQKAGVSIVKRATSVAVSAAIALSGMPAVAQASTLSHALASPVETDYVTCEVTIVGPDQNEVPLSYASFVDVVPEGTTADAVTEDILNRAGLTHESSNTQYGYYLSSITSPITGNALAWNEETGEYWALVVNDELSEVGASQVEVHEGTRITWEYLSSEFEGFAQRLWRGFGNAGSSMAFNTNTPSSSSKMAWIADLKGDYLTRHPDAADALMGYVNVSDIIVLRWNVYVAVGQELQRRDADTGEVLSTVSLSAPIDYTCRPILADGKLIVPEHGGVLEAFTIQDDELERAWVTEAVGEFQQNSGALVARNGCVYAATFETGPDYAITSGWVLAVDIATGKTVWQAKNEGSGYYWGGLAAAGSYGLIADDRGTLRSFALEANEEAGLAAGDVVGQLELGCGVRSVPAVAFGGSCAYVMATDGVLHKVAVAEDGSLTHDSEVKVANSSTCTPALYGDQLVVGGTSSQTVETRVGDDIYTSPAGRVVVVDARSMEVVRSVEKLEDGSLIPGDVKSRVLASRGYSHTDVYFTANGNPGALYRWNASADDQPARVVFTPASGQQNYCMAMPVFTHDGGILYTNDSGSMFSISAGALHWIKDAGFWYLVDDRETAQYGWQKMNGGQYHLDNETGKMDTGWYWDKVLRLWFWLGGKDDGRAAEGWRLIEGKWYYFDPFYQDMKTGWTWIEGEWYWLGTSGAMHTGWQWIDNAWYYFDANGHMLRSQVVDGYRLSDSGAWVV